MKRRGHLAKYEQMFEDLLREKGILYIAINEKKRPIYKGTKIKNFDFIVSSFNGKFMIDVKGKKFSYRKNGKPDWENWVSQDDVSGLMEWSTHFSAFTPLLVFPYLLSNPTDNQHFVDIRSFKGSQYGITAIELSKYYTEAVTRDPNPKWKAINVPRNKFGDFLKPISHFIPELQKKW